MIITDIKTKKREKRKMRERQRKIRWKQGALAADLIYPLLVVTFDLCKARQGERSEIRERDRRQR